MPESVKPEASLASQYDAEASPTPQAATPEPAANTEPTPAETRPTPPKDPATGRFVSPPPPESQQHNPRLVQWAHDLGMNDDDLVDIPADHLEHVLRTVNRQALARGRDNSIERTIAGTGQQDQGEPPITPAPPAETMDWGTSESGEPLSEKDYNPVIVRMFKELRAEIGSLKQHINTLHHREAVRTNETMAERCDRKFAEYKTVLGDGTKDDFANDSVEMQRRRAVLSLVQMDKGKGSLEVKIDKAVRTLYGKRAETPTPAPKPSNGSRISPEDWEAAGLARPTARTVDPEPNGEAKAIKSVAKALREIGEAPPSEQGSGSATVEDFI